MSLAEKGKIYTYQDYLQWPDEIHHEIIGGVPCNMSPAPSIRHQLLSGNLFRILSRQLSGKPCIAFSAPTDVVLSDVDVVQPDIFVVCDHGKITSRSIQGAPDLVMEILNTHTCKKDRWEKRWLYQRSGVREYLLVEPASEFIERYLQENGSFTAGEVFSDEQSIPLVSLPGCTLSLREVFTLPLELP